MHPFKPLEYRLSPKKWGVFFLLILFALAVTGEAVNAEENASIQHIKEVAPGLLEGYLAQEMLPDSLSLLPSPPAEDSPAFAVDRDISKQSIALQGTPRWEQAVKDANLHFPEAIDGFVEIVDVPITEAKTPHLYMLLRRTLTDMGLSTYAAKTHYNRERPFMVNNEPVCTPDEEEVLRKDSSYPSGHTAIGWGWALLLCELFPEKTDALLKRGWEFGQSRIICNVHWQSDVDRGRIMGAATVARLHADAGFLADLEAAKAEIVALRER
jgi:acid phosphatase (class A)